MRALRVSLVSFLALIASILAKDQEFRFEKPDAQTVELMAEFNQWKGEPMTKEANGIWTIKVSVPPGTYGYKFLVDGKDWVFDPKNSQRKTADGVENSSIEVRDDLIARSTPFASPTGTPLGQASVFAAKATGSAG